MDLKINRCIDNEKMQSFSSMCLFKPVHVVTYLHTGEKPQSVLPLCGFPSLSHKVVDEYVCFFRETLDLVMPASPCVLLTALAFSEESYSSEGSLLQLFSLFWQKIHNVQCLHQFNTAGFQFEWTSHNVRTELNDAAV